MREAVHLSRQHSPALISRALGVARSSLYRAVSRRGGPRQPSRRKPPARALRPPEREAVVQVLHSIEYVDQAPASVWADLLEQGRYLCSVRTMYRILSERGEVRERRNQLRHPKYERPELLATAPNQCWSWDITKLKGPVKWSYFYLYVVLDIFSRYVVGWLLSTQERAALARTLIEQSCLRQGIVPGELTLHADRGSPMIAKNVALLLADLGVTKSHSRPHTSTDNPYSEAQFKTLKYRPEFPERFGSPQQARQFSRRFFQWYNRDHRHSGVGLHTPEDVHYGRAEGLREIRARTLLRAYELNPERFPNGPPEPPELPQAVWINRPKTEKT